MIALVERLLHSEEPSVRFKVLVKVLHTPLESMAIKELQEEIRCSPRVRRLLSERDSSSKIPVHPYKKWYGAHWVLYCLAELGYPANDDSLIPLREQIYEWLLAPDYEKQFKAIAGRMRKCASQEGNALFYLLTLGLADSRVEILVERLLRWQWPDGGWNCDKKPSACHSSFMESILALRGLAFYARISGSRSAQTAALRAAEIFLQRRLFLRRTTGEGISPDFVRLHFPWYWHYDVLLGLKVMVEVGLIDDSRGKEALNLLTTKRLPNGGYPAEKRFYQVTESRKPGRSLVDWGGTSKNRLNEWVTAEALAVLKESGHLAAG